MHARSAWPDSWRTHRHAFAATPDPPLFGDGRRWRDRQLCDRYRGTEVCVRRDRARDASEAIGYKAGPPFRIHARSLLDNRCGAVRGTFVPVDRRGHVVQVQQASGAPLQFLARRRQIPRGSFLAGGLRLQQTAERQAVVLVLIALAMSIGTKVATAGQLTEQRELPAAIQTSHTCLIGANRAFNQTWNAA